MKKGIFSGIQPTGGIHLDNKLSAIKQEYNNHRPHSSLSYLTPSGFARRYYEKNQVKEFKQPVETTGSLSL